MPLLYGFWTLFLTLFVFCFAQNKDYGFRNYYMPIAAAAYSDNPSKCLTNLQNLWATLGYPDRNISVKNNILSCSDMKGCIIDVATFMCGEKKQTKFMLYRQYNVKCTSLNTTCSGYIAIDHSVDGNIESVEIAFVGPKNSLQLFQHGLNFDEMVPLGGIAGKVNKMFFDAFNEIWRTAGMRDDILYLKNKYQGAPFDLIGHSIGGAMASIAAATLISTSILSNQNRVSLTTFGQPRTGDKIFADALNTWIYVDFESRIVHYHDPVPHFPPLNSSSYYHHLHEFWYSNDMGNGDNYKACSYNDGEDQTCSNSLNSTMLTYDDHLNYYGRNFVDYGINGCPDLATIKQ